MIRFTYEGKEFEFRGEHKTPLLDQYYLSTGGVVAQCTHEWLSESVRAIVHPVLVIHEFGGIKFVETGELREVGVGEWYMPIESNWPYFSGESLTKYKQRILKRYEE